MNTNFNPARVIQTHLQEVPAHPINGAKHWAVHGRVHGRGFGPDGKDVLLGRGATIGDAFNEAQKTVQRDYPGLTL